MKIQDTHELDQSAHVTHPTKPRVLESEKHLGNQ